MAESKGPFDPDEIERLSREFLEKPRPVDPSLALAEATALIATLRGEVAALEGALARERAERERAASAYETMSAAQLSLVALLQDQLRSLGADLSAARARAAEIELERDRLARFADSLASQRVAADAYAALEDITRRLAMLRASSAALPAPPFSFSEFWDFVPRARDGALALLRRVRTQA